MKSKTRTVRKVCARCGQKGWFRPRMKNCRQRKFGPDSYCCWGELTPTRKEKPVLTDELHEYQGANAAIARGAALRTDAERRLRAARKMVTDRTRQMTRLATSLRLWERRAAYYAKRASLTDAEIEAERTARAARPKKTRRALALGKEVS